MAANTDHDETYNREHWHEGEAWLGLESMRAPQRPQQGASLRTTFVPALGIDLPHGTISGDAATKVAQTNGRRTYR